MTYTLTAILGKTAQAVSFEADHDNDAMMSAIAKIMNLAYENPTGPWGKGEIILRDEDGRVVETMPAK